MTNVLFALDEPVAALKEIHRVLRDGSVVAFSTSDGKTDIERLFRDIREEFVLNGEWTESVKKLHAEALERNREMLKIIERYTEKDVEGFFKDAGFADYRCVDRAQYVGCVFIGTATK
jgi:hypothetical protein